MPNLRADVAGVMRTMLREAWRADEFWLREASMGHRVSQPEVLSVRKVVVYELLSLDGVAEDHRVAICLPTTASSGSG